MIVLLWGLPHYIFEAGLVAVFVFGLVRTIRRWGARRRLAQPVVAAPGAARLVGDKAQDYFPGSSAALPTSASAGARPRTVLSQADFLHGKGIPLPEAKHETDAALHPPLDSSAAIREGTSELNRKKEYLVAPSAHDLAR